MLPRASRDRQRNARGRDDAPRRSRGPTWRCVSSCVDGCENSRASVRQSGKLGSRLVTGDWISARSTWSCVVRWSKGRSRQSSLLGRLGIWALAVRGRGGGGLDGSGDGDLVRRKRIGTTRVTIHSTKRSAFTYSLRPFRECYRTINAQGG